MNQRYNPCLECFNRYGKQYSEDCNNTCDYAYAVKLRDTNIEDLNLIIEKLEHQLKTPRRVSKNELAARMAKINAKRVAILTRERLGLKG